MESPKVRGVSASRKTVLPLRPFISTAFKIIASKHQQIHRKFAFQQGPITHGEEGIKA